MKVSSYVLILAGVMLLTFSGCGGGGSTGTSPITPPTPPTTTTFSKWTWVGGSNLADQTGSYGTLGVPAASNVPPARHGAISWTDASGNFWLFGGIEAPTQESNRLFNDLWKYSQGQWTWVGGSNTVNHPGVYGTQGIAAPGNIPGARTDAAGWTDAAGNLWLFGGVGLDANGTSVRLNDLWKYSAGQWTWTSGSNVGSQTQPGIYGTRGIPAPNNFPGARSNAVCWTDASGNFWLFGGYGYDSSGNWAGGNLNDLWRYSGGQWTWMSGSNLVYQPAVYGTQGIAAPANVPAARREALGWTDAAGNFWLFGGVTALDGSFRLSNELWKYSAGQWTWMSGSSGFNEPGRYGTLGTPSSSNVPGARVLAIGWTDASGNLWLFGGDGVDSVGQGVGDLNDLWRYSGGQWTWMGGSNAKSQPGTYGTLGIASPGNVPGARSWSVGWKDGSGNFWLFGGSGYDSSRKLGYLNDLWKCEP